MLEMYAHIPLFQDLTPTQTAQLDPLFEHFSYPVDTLIFEQGENPHYLYLLLKGTVAIRYKPYDTPAITLTHLREGSVFGWSAVIGSKYYTSSSVSVSDVEGLRLHEARLWRLVEEHPATGKVVLDRLANVVSSRWKNAHTEVQALFDKAMKRSRNRGGQLWSQQSL